MEEGYKERFVIRWMRQILSGLMFYHDQKIVHLDVKVRHFFFSKSTSPFIYFTSFREQDNPDINSLQWSASMGLEPAYPHM